MTLMTCQTMPKASVQKPVEDCPEDDSFASAVLFIGFSLRTFVLIVNQCADAVGMAAHFSSACFCSSLSRAE